MSLLLVTAPTTYPISISEVTDHLRMSETEAQARLIDLNRLITDAAAFAEDCTWRALITQTWDYFIDSWPKERHLIIPRPPLQSVTGVYYTADGEAEATFTDYEVDEVSEPGRIFLERDESWPTDTLTPAKPIRVRYIAGYGDAGSDVPPRIKQAMLLHVEQNHSGVNHADTIANILRNYRITNSQYDA
jgi:uncharacterized phiE125 gp8 family phage protein